MSRGPEVTGETPGDGSPPTTEARPAPVTSEFTEPALGLDGWDQLPPPVFEPGRVVFGKYRLIEKIGVGGMGEVWKVQNIELDRTSALKLIKPEIARNENGWIRFQREARLMAKLDHANAVAVHDFRRAQSMGYIEMEFIRGRSLEQVLHDSGGQPLAVERVARILDQLCAVLHEAHGHRDEESGRPKPIIHRDLKPSNLMLVERGRPGEEVQLKVLDFGIAKMIEDDGDGDGGNVTGAHDIVGTPAYMSPEQIRGGLDGGDAPKDIDARSDIYSAGVVLYHLLTGTLPFSGNKMTLLASHLNGTPMAIHEANPSATIPATVERLVMKCLEKDPARRPQSARELAEAFRVAAGLESAPATADPSRPKAPPWPAIAAVAAVVVLGAGFLIVPRLPRHSTAESPPVSVAEAAPAVVPEPATIAKSKDVDRRPTAPTWMPEGFASATSEIDAESGLSKAIKRKGDGARFHLEPGGLYLPDGYKAAGTGPSAIVRQLDRVRFVRIDGGVFLRGDPRPGAQPATDVPGNPITRHHVRVAGFYIQDREVTNGEIRRYLTEHTEAERALSEWRRRYDYLRSEYHLDEEHADRFPAVQVSQRGASRYAAAVGGFLPTEAQWEFAAKSRKDDPLFAWGREFPAGAERPANLDNPEHVPAEVGTYPKDATGQGVLDMTGNVREFCDDAYAPYDQLDLSGNGPDRPLIDRRAAIESDSVKAVVRGGSFDDKPRRAFTFMRDRLGVTATSGSIGFRVVIECPSRDEGPVAVVGGPP